MAENRTKWVKNGEPKVRNNQTWAIPPLLFSYSFLERLLSSWNPQGDCCVSPPLSNPSPSWRIHLFPSFLLSLSLASFPCFESSSTSHPVPRPICRQKKTAHLRGPSSKAAKKNHNKKKTPRSSGGSTISHFWFWNILFINYFKIFHFRFPSRVRSSAS